MFIRFIPFSLLSFLVVFPISVALAEDLPAVPLKNQGMLQQKIDQEDCEYLSTQYFPAPKEPIDTKQEELSELRRSTNPVSLMTLNIREKQAKRTERRYKQQKETIELKRKNFIKNCLKSKGYEISPQ